VATPPVAPPDAAPPPPDVGPPGGPGEPCPCEAHLRCIDGTCYLKCKRGGLCGAVSSCPADHACVEACADTDVCMPAVGAGQPCDGKTYYCANGHVCASDNGGQYRCVPVCSPVGSGCGQGGTCMTTGAPNCTICSSP
jgi:hypothetical protein